MFTEHVAAHFNSMAITRVCADIDKGLDFRDELKHWLLFLIRCSVDLSIPSKRFQPYRDAYAFVKSQLKELQV